MADVIRLLPDSVANQIAAGEVVKRPASVIKELVENAIDAGAKRIDIYIKDGGRTLIQVIDDGCGMSTTDARMAFERHATSKIKAAADLFTLHTMGFRGEALPSICAISQVEVRTRRSEDSIGTKLVINGSKVESQESDICDKGTNISVRNLFYNVPARRKFMKSDSVETSHILREFERMALVNNNVHLSIDTGGRQIDLRPANFRQRIADIWKNNLAGQLVPIEVETEMVRIKGYVSRPEFARRRNALQFMMVNGRNMYHPRFHKGVLKAFETLIAHDTQPCYFIKMEVNPDSIDVNIHPTKHEIKFEYEQQIWSILFAAVKASLGKNSAVPSIDFNSDVLPVASASDNPVLPPDMARTSGYNPFHSKSVPNDWEKMYSDFMGETKSSLSETQGWNDFNDGAFEYSVEIDKEGDNILGLDVNNDGTICLHCHQGYIATNVKDGLLIIDQHRAHFKVLYEQVLDKIKGGEIVSQVLMFSEPISLDERQIELLKTIKQQLAETGLKLQFDGDLNVRIIAIPTFLDSHKAKDVVLGMLDAVTDMSLAAGPAGASVDSIQQKLAISMAKSSAIRRNQALSNSEMESLVSDLFKLPDSQYTPEGKKIYTVIDLRSLL